MMDAAQEYEMRLAYLEDLTPEGQLRELLAVLHADGGHYVRMVGLARAVADAELKYLALSAKGQPK